MSTATATTITAFPPEIDALNAEARQIQSTHALSPHDAVCRLVNIRGFEEIAADETSAVYRLESGRLVNCWFEGSRSEEIEEGGLGFDTQVEWVRDRAASEAE